MLYGVTSGFMVGLQNHLLHGGPGDASIKDEMDSDCEICIQLEILDEATKLRNKGFSEWSAYSLWYLPVSLLIAMLIHETYYYWLHRWMHRPKIYRLVHKWHHDSIETTSFTAFSFHPIESILQALMIPVLIIFLPMHLSVLLLFLIIMTISATINHAGIEIYPASFNRHWLGKWIIGATHHDLHHKQFRYNFGLYFTFWDRWMKTESPESDQWFEKHANH